MRVTRLDPSSYRRMPWKNGLGLTTEIARAPQDGDFDWRVSVANVEADGPFSAFPGCDRVILTLEGAGMALTHREAESHVAIGPLEPWAFSGDWTTTCALRDGPIRDFNVIARRAAWSARVTVLRVSSTIETSAAIVLLYSVEGSAVVDGVPLDRGGTLIVEPDEPAHVAVSLSAHAVVVAVELTQTR